MAASILEHVHAVMPHNDDPGYVSDGSIITPPIK
jgi:hypothetical protein